MFLPRLQRILSYRGPRNSRAFAFYATNDTYAVAVLVFVHLLRQLGMRQDADVVVLHRPLDPSILERMRRMGIVTRPACDFRGVRRDHYRYSFIKLRFLGMSEYEQVLYADADAIPLRSLDPLFDRPMSRPIAAPSAYWLPQPFWTSALFLAKPSRALWRRVRPRIASAARSGHYDMDILNAEFGAGEIETLPSGIFSLNSEWVGTEPSYLASNPVSPFKGVSVVHFSALGKPWSRSTIEAKIMRPKAEREFFELWERWRSTRDAVMQGG